MELCDNNHDAIVHDESECPLCKALGSDLQDTISEAKDATDELVSLMRRFNKLLFPVPKIPDNAFFELSPNDAVDASDELGAMMTDLRKLQQEVHRMRDALTTALGIAPRLTPVAFLVEVRAIVEQMDEQVTALKGLDWEPN